MDTYNDQSLIREFFAQRMAEPDVTPAVRAGHPRFYEFLDDIARLHAAKNRDYSDNTDPLRNLRQAEDIGLPPWVGVVLRLTDKMDRLKTFARRRDYAVKSESFIDTCMDMAVYALLAAVLFEEDEAKQP